MLRARDSPNPIARTEAALSMGLVSAGACCIVRVPPHGAAYRSAVTPVTVWMGRSAGVTMVVVVVVGVGVLAAGVSHIRFLSCCNFCWAGHILDGSTAFICLMLLATVVEHVQRRPRPRCNWGNGTRTWLCMYTGHCSGRDHLIPGVSDSGQHSLPSPTRYCLALFVKPQAP